MPQLRALETEHDAARQEIADLKAKNAEQAALIAEQAAFIEQLLAETNGS